MEAIHSERLTLRPLGLDDARFIFELVNEPSFIQNIGDRGVRTLADAEKYIENGPLASYAKNGFGLLAVTLKETGEPIGMCGLIKRDTLEDVDIGYAFLPKFWLKGYAVEAARTVMGTAKALGLKRVVAIVDPANTGSIRVLERLGMSFEKMVRLTADDIELKLFSVAL
ncbi:MAG TPA: GNAT family N-acetyltransferase [Anaerolineales bacterium]|nr:GNAT family N-acetyltransferase [Anaerolineales bacterium]